MKSKPDLGFRLLVLHICMPSSCRCLLMQEDVFSRGSPKLDHYGTDFQRDPILTKPTRRLTVCVPQLVVSKDVSVARPPRSDGMRPGRQNRDLP